MVRGEILLIALITGILGLCWGIRHRVFLLFFFAQESFHQVFLGRNTSRLNCNFTAVGTKNRNLVKPFLAKGENPKEKKKSKSLTQSEEDLGLEALKLKVQRIWKKIGCTRCLPDSAPRRLIRPSCSR